MGKRAYIALFIVLFVILALTIYTPYLAFTNPEGANTIYTSFEWACHQKISRSECLFQNHSTSSFYIADCTSQLGKNIQGDNHIVETVNEAVDTGFKFLVCARDVGIYLGMFIVLLAYPFFKKLDDPRLPSPLLYIIALIPIGLDGGIQVLSSLGFLSYESTNMVRLITGLIAGGATTYFLLPIANNIGKKKQIQQPVKNAQRKKFKRRTN
ncbi:MAG: DUF2085 domain-containing protein [Candidatus Micrarchaeota archaeon]